MSLMCKKASIKQGKIGKGYLARIGKRSTLKMKKSFKKTQLDFIVN